MSGAGYNPATHAFGPWELTIPYGSNCLACEHQFAPVRRLSEWSVERNAQEIVELGRCPNCGGDARRILHLRPGAGPVSLSEASIANATRDAEATPADPHELRWEWRGAELVLVSPIDLIVGSLTPIENLGPDVWNCYDGFNYVGLESAKRALLRGYCRRVAAIAERMQLPTDGPHAPPTH